MLFSHTIAHGNLMILTTHILCAFIDSFVVDYFDDIHSNNLG
jgi:FlaG/FlaF family flagellin (archaellin)